MESRKSSASGARPPSSASSVRVFVPCVSVQFVHVITVIITLCLRGIKQQAVLFVCSVIYLMLNYVTPVRCSHFTLGNPKVSFSTVLFIHTSYRNINKL